MFNTIVGFITAYFATLSPEYRRILAKRRLEQIAIEAGASRSVAKRIVAVYFARPKNVAQ